MVFTIISDVSVHIQSMKILQRDLQTLNLKFDQVMFNSIVFTWERKFEVTFDIFSVLVIQINVPGSYLNICLF